MTTPRIEQPGILASALRSTTPADAGAGRRRERVYRVKLWLLLGLVLCLAVIPTIDMIRARRERGPETLAHDGVLQVESAIEYALTGRNPYREDYFGTPLQYWEWRDQNALYDNPALYHLAYLPAMFLLGVPLRSLSLTLFNWYDQRFLYLLALLVALWAWGSLARDPTRRLLALAVVGLNPLALPYLIEGRNDIVIVALVGLSLVALDRGRLGLSGALFGLACATKQSAWFLAPFLLLYVWGARERLGLSAERRVALREVARSWLLPAGAVAALFIGPYFLSDPRSFWEDTISYISGNVEHNFPIKREGAYGLHVLLWSPRWAGMLDALTSGPLAFLRPVAERFKLSDELQPYPFWVFQALFALPVLALCLRAQLRRNTIAAALAGYALGLLAYQYFGRFLHDNYIGYAATMWALAYTAREPGVLPAPVASRAAVAGGVRGRTRRLAPALPGALVLVARRVLWAAFALWLAITVTYFGLGAAFARYDSGQLGAAINGPAPPLTESPPLEEEPLTEELPPEDLPLIEQPSLENGPPLGGGSAGDYVRFLGGAVRMDWGRSSAAEGRPVREVVWDGVPVTARVVVFAFALAVLLGVPLGVLAATRRGWVDRAVSSGATLAYSAPTLVLSILLLALSVRTIQAFPAGWSPERGWQNYLLPVLALGLSGGGYLARATRAAVLEVLGQDYVRTARAKGLREGLISRRHVLRNALPTLLAALGPTLGLLLAGSLLVEYAYEIPGAGRLLLSGFGRHDYPLILAGVTLYTALVLGANLLADLAALLADPRARGGA